MREPFSRYFTISFINIEAYIGITAKISLETRDGEAEAGGGDGSLFWKCERGGGGGGEGPPPAS